MIRALSFRPLLLLSLILFLPAGPLPAQKLDDAALDDLLGKLEALQTSTPGLSAQFKETRKSGILAQPMVSTGDLTFREPAYFRREITGKRPSLTVSDGETLWIYYPRFKEAEKYRIGEGRPVDEAVEALLAGTNFKRVRSSYEIHGEKKGDGYELEMRPLTRALRRLFKSMVLTLDDDLNVVRSEVKLSRGDTVVTEFSAIKRFSPPLSKFEFTPPEGTRVSEPLR